MLESNEKTRLVPVVKNPRDTTVVVIQTIRSLAAISTDDDDLRR